MAAGAHHSRITGHLRIDRWPTMAALHSDATAANSDAAGAWSSDKRAGSSETSRERCSNGVVPRAQAAQTASSRSPERASHISGRPPSLIAGCGRGHTAVGGP
jgi:hypothetical protein